MTIAVRYYVTSKSGSYIDWSARYVGFDLPEGEMYLAGAAGSDSLSVQSGASVMATNLGGGDDKVYLSGALGEYTQSIDQSTGVYTFSRPVGGQTEVVKILVSDANDQLYFADGHITINPDVEGRLVDGEIFHPIESGWLQPGGTPSGPVSTAPLTESNVEPVKVFVEDAGGVYVPALTQPGQVLTAAGSAGVDTIYVGAGTTVDATALAGGNDKIYVMGALAEYTQVIDQGTGTYTLTRTVAGKIESIKFVVGDQDDQIYFADGHITINAEKDLRLYDGVEFKPLQADWLVSGGTVTQTMADALAKITAYADSSSNPVPTVTDYHDAGVVGVTADNLAAVNYRVDAVVKTAADELAEVQALVYAAAAAPTGLAVSPTGTALTGSAEPGATVTVKAADGTVLGTATAGADGQFSVPLSTPQTDGQTVSVTAGDAGGTSAPATATAPDTTAPNTPANPPAHYADNMGSIQNAVSTASVTDDTTPAIQVGTGLTDTPKLYVDGVLVAADYDSTNGTLTPAEPLAAGAHTFSYTLTDAAGNESGQSPTRVITIDATEPAAPSLVLGADVADGATAAEATAGTGVVTVTAESGASTVVTFTNGSQTISKTVTGNGSTPVPVVLTDADLATLGNGVISVSATATDAAGNASSAGTTSFTLDTTAPSVTPVTGGATEDATATSVNLLSGASDANGGLRLGSSITYTVNGAATGSSGTALPAGFSLVGHQLTVDTTDSTFDALAAGQTQTVVASYQVLDAAGNASNQSATVTVTGINDAPLVTSTSINSTVTGLLPANDAVMEVLNLQGGTYSLTGVNLQSTIDLLNSNTNFSASGTYAKDVLIVAQPASVTATYLSQANLAFDGYTANGSYLSGEITAIKDWVTAGNVLISTNDAPTYSPLATAFAMTAVTSSNSPTWVLTGQTQVDGSTAAAATKAAALAILNGPFGSWTSGSTILAGDSASYFDPTKVLSTDIVLAWENGYSATTRPTIVLRPYGEGYVLLTGDEGIFRRNIAGVIDNTQEKFVANLFAWAETQGGASSGAALSSIMPASTDADAGSSLQGWAITQAGADSSGQGQWEYKSGSSWVSLSSASLTNAVFLAADTMVRWNGSSSATGALRAVAVDNTATATQGGALDVSVRGGSTPYSDGMVSVVTAPNGYKDNVGAVQSDSSWASVTDDTTPGLNVGAGLTETVKLYVDGVLVDATYDPVTGALTPTAPLSQGTYQLSYTVTNASGIEGDPSPALMVTVDSQAPTFTSSNIDLATASDNGLSATDNATTLQTPTVTASFTGVTDTSLTTTFYDDKDNSGTYTAGDTILALGVSTTVSAGTATASTTLNLADGSYKVKAFLADAAGNVSTTSASLDNANKSVVVATPVAASSVGGSQANDGLGLSLNSAGDFNGDGYEDFIVSAPHNQYGENAVNAADIYLIYGTANGIPSISNVDNMTSAQGIQYTNSASGFDGYTGTVVKGIGDLNGDGYSDVVIGGLLGRNYVVWGGVNKAAVLDLATMNAGATANGFMMSGSSEWFGDGMASADLDHDGISDLIVGDSYSAMTTDTGSAYVIYGHTGTWTNMVGTTTGMTGATGAVSTFKGGTYFGDRIGVVGDVNNDGYDDFVINSPGADGVSGVNSGVSTLVFGTATGYPTSGVINLGTDTTPTSYGIKISGSETYEYLGGIAWAYATNNLNGDAYYNQSLTMSSVGDFNGDNITDFIIGSPYWDGAGADAYATAGTGRAYVFYGHAGAWSDMTASTAATAGKGFILTASNVGTNADLGFAVAGGGDYNNDGYDDFLVTAVQASTNGLTNNGAVWLVFGKSGGHSGTVDLTTLVANGQALRWDGAASYNFMGTNVAMGDWNNDGYADVAIPQWKATSNLAAGAGAFKIYYGNAVGAKGPTGTTPVTLDLNGDGQIGYSHVVLDVDGDGQKDLTAWTDATDGVLVWDKLGDSVVHDNSQYAFSQYGGHTDLEGLAAAFDTNQDGTFNAMDALFAQFAVWQDVNQNGVSDAGEVQSLTELGLVEVNLTSDGVQRQPADGVVESGRTTATLADGSTMTVADVEFAYEAVPQQQDGTIFLSTPEQLLADLVRQATGTQLVDLSQDVSANTLDITLSDVLAADQQALVVTADTNDVVRLDSTTWVNNGTTTTVGEHTYALWTQAGAHLLMDTNATVQQPVL